MTDLLAEHPIVGFLAAVALLWSMGVVSALVVLLFLHPTDLGTPAASVAVAIVAIPGAVLLTLRVLKGAKS